MWRHAQQWEGYSGVMWSVKCIAMEKTMLGVIGGDKNYSVDSSGRNGSKDAESTLRLTLQGAINIFCTAAMITDSETILQ